MQLQKIINLSLISTISTSPLSWRYDQLNKQTDQRTSNQEAITQRISFVEIYLRFKVTGIQKHISWIWSMNSFTSFLKKHSVTHRWYRRIKLVREFGIMKSSARKSLLWEEVMNSEKGEIECSDRLISLLLLSSNVIEFTLF